MGMPIRWAIPGNALGAVSPIEARNWNAQPVPVRGVAAGRAIR